MRQPTFTVSSTSLNNYIGYVRSGIGSKVDLPGKHPRQPCLVWSSQILFLLSLSNQGIMLRQAIQTGKTPNLHDNLDGTKYRIQCRILCFVVVVVVVVVAAAYIQWLVSNTVCFIPSKCQCAVTSNFPTSAGKSIAEVRRLDQEPHLALSVSLARFGNSCRSLIRNPYAILLPYRFYSRSNNNINCIVEEMK
jgi:hypothetical protein